MNRGIHVCRPAPSVQDLKVTASGIVSSQHLEASLQALAEAYYEVYQTQEKKDFFGLRDFYSLIKFLHRKLEHTLTPELLYRAVTINFGGMPSHADHILRVFFSRVGMMIPSGHVSFFDEPLGLSEGEVDGTDGSAIAAHLLEKCTTLNLIQVNLRDENARHLMLLTRNDAALSILFEERIVHYSDAVVLFGSDFPKDQSDLHICLNIQTIKTCMADGRTVVLIHSENLYESLYDMLNQHYVSYEDQRFVRIALGTHSRLVPVHRAFRVIVVVEAIHAYTSLAPPLLNRFEKQVLMRPDLLSHQQRQLVDRLLAWFEDFVNPDVEIQRTRFLASSAFVGAHEDTVSSLVLALSPRTAEFNEDAVFRRAINRLLMVATPESVVRANRLSSKKIDDWERVYFQEQTHTCLNGLLGDVFAQLQLVEMRRQEGELERAIADVKARAAGTEEEAEATEVGQSEASSEMAAQLEAQHEKLHSEVVSLGDRLDRCGLDFELADDLGVQMRLMTFSPISVNIRALVSARYPRHAVTVLKVHEFSSESELAHEIQSALELPDDSFVVLQVDPAACSLQRIQHTRNIWERERSAHQIRVEAEASAYQDEAQKASDAAAAVGHDSEGNDAGQGRARPTPRRLFKKHVLLMVHMNRSATGAYKFDFDRTWQNVFLDELRDEEASSAPSTTEMLENNEMELIHLMKLKPTLQGLFRSCIARLIYPYNRTSGDIQNQIELMLGLFEDEPFMNVLKERLYELIDESIERIGHGAMTWQLMVASSANEIALAGTFRDALFHRLSFGIASVFTQVACYLERNFASQLYMRMASSADEAGRRLWLRLFSDKSVCNVRVVAGSPTAHYDVLNDGRDRLLHARFPFSFVFIHALESMREEAEKLPGALDEALERLMRSAFPSVYVREGDKARAEDEDLNGASENAGEWALSRDQLDDYLHDYVLAMCGRTVVDEEAIQVIHRSLMTKALRQPLSSLAHIHAAYWENEQRLYHVFHLADLLRGTSLVSSFLSRGIPRLVESSFSLVHLDQLLLTQVLALVSPSEAALASPEDQRAWIDLVADVQPPVDALMASTVAHFGESHHACAQISHRWKCIRLLRLFVRDVAFTLALDASAVLDVFAVLMSEGTFMTASPFEKLLAGISRSLSRYKRKVRRGKRSEYKEVMATAKQRCSLFVSRYITDILLPSRGAADQLEPALVDSLLQVLTNRQPHFSSTNTIHELPPNRKKGSLPATSALRSHICAHLLRSNADRVIHVHKRLGLYLGQELETEASLLVVLASEDLEREQCGEGEDCGSALDSNPSARMVSTACATASELVATRTATRESEGEDEHIVKRLRRIGRARFVLSTLARHVCAAAGTRGNISVTSLNGALLHAANELVGAGGSVLAASSGAEDEAVHCEPMQTFVMRQCARLRGVPFCQLLLKDEGMRSAVPWLAEYSQLPKVEHFLRKRHLLQHDPFRTESGYDPVRRLVQGAVDGRLAPLKAWAELAPEDEGARARDNATLLLALVQEVLVLYTAPASLPSAGITELAQWLETSAVGGRLSRELVPFYVRVCRNELGAAEGVSGESANAAGFWRVNGDTSSEHVVLLLLAMHVCATAISSAHHPDALLYGLLARPASLARVFLPTMPDDERQALMAVLGGGWYECPNGHTYYVDACGRPTEVLHCATCGAKIGGIDHELDPTNRAASAEVDRTPPGYVVGAAATAALAAAKKMEADTEGGACAPTAHSSTSPGSLLLESDSEDAAANRHKAKQAAEEAEEEDRVRRFFSERALSPVSYRCLRFIQHVLLSLSAATGVATTETGLAGLLHPEPDAAAPGAEGMTAASSSDVADPAAFMRKQMMADWNILKRQCAVPAEECALAVHLVLARLGGNSPGTGRKGRRSGGSGRRSEILNLLAVSPLDKGQRKSWEDVFQSEHSAPVLDALHSQLQHFYEAQGADASLVSELKETLPLKDIGVSERRIRVPTLWRFRAPVSLDGLRQQMNARPDNALRYPVLRLFLTEENQLRALKHMRSCLRWPELLSQRFDRRVDREWARTHTAEDILSEVRGEERSVWEHAFAGWEEAWNSAWRFVDGFVCLEMPAIFKEIRMDRHTPLCFSLPGNRDEGTCAISFLRYLVEKHNQFLGNVFTALNSKANTKKALTEQRSVPTHLLSDTDLISYDPAQLLPMLRAHADQDLRYGAGEVVTFNMELIEQHLVDSILAGKPLIDFEVRTFSFTNETRITGALSALRLKIPQTELPLETKKKILSELQETGRVRHTLELLEVCIGFLAATGGTLVKLPGSVPLRKYVVETLVMNDVVVSTGTIARSVQLQHVASLWTWLDESLSVDISEGVHPEYKTNLTTAQEAEFKLACGRMDLKILQSALKQVLVERLAQRDMGPSTPLVDVISAEEDVAGVDMYDCEWLSNFPRTILLENALATYRVLDSIAS
eukprot:TRINITY_DN9326_c0_g1_i1.p1 TRINITY_DN9326_c0_g1~~TRINITY_DN9326_c0_g1_i1.p1  ORF type:complete len:2486 (-),score=415.42 TRINITY_DN9326_c0_g1_i1:106-7416(-)